ncbi:MAG: hypothetical protein IKC80_10550 [Kiritimatiellae bacterium]|nr:hypothetical protein [Kiritimatiellia bacterium]
MKEKSGLIWANLLQLGENMWNDRKTVEVSRFDERVWEHVTGRMSGIGMNMLVIDLAEGMEYPSHPELAIKGSWTPQKMKRELSRLRALGIEPVPKLNFSTCHDVWLKEYARMVSTPEYYRVVSDLIRDTCRIFGNPRFFHIGMDEETYRVQRAFDYVVCRNGDLWYQDLDFYRREVEKNGARAMMWSDQAWSEPPFAEKVSKRIVQNNWYYWNDVPRVEPQSLLPRPPDEKKTDDAMHEWSHVQQLRAFRELDAAGFDQMPCATNWNNRENMAQVADYSMKHISPERLLGFLFTPWEFTFSGEQYVKKHNELLDLAGDVIKRIKSLT